LEFLKASATTPTATSFATAVAIGGSCRIVVVQQLTVRFSFVIAIGHLYYHDHSRRHYLICDLQQATIVAFVE
jgi:hypothetical protein